MCVYGCVPETEKIQHLLLVHRRPTFCFETGKQAGLISSHTHVFNCMSFPKNTTHAEYYYFTSMKLYHMHNLNTVIFRKKTNYVCVFQNTTNAGHFIGTST